MRVKADGASLDSTFGINGYLYTDIQGRDYDRIYSIALQADGKIVAAGESRKPNNVNVATIARYLPDAPSSITQPNGSLSGIHIYPNPVNNVVHIAFDRGMHHFKIELVSSIGIVVISREDIAQYSSLNISSLPSGIYFLTITENNKMFTQTIQKL